MQVLINQLKDVAPTIQNSISELTEEVNSISSNPPPVMNFRLNSPIQTQSSGRTLVTYIYTLPLLFLEEISGVHVYLTAFNEFVYTQESGVEDVAEITSRLSSIQIENVSASPPTLKLPPLFSSTPSGKGVNMQKRHNMAQVIPAETIIDKKFVENPPSNSHMDNPTHGL